MDSLIVAIELIKVLLALIFLAGPVAFLNSIALFERLPPLPVFNIPLDSFAQSVGKVNQWLPSQFRADFGAIKQISPVMARPIGHICFHALRQT